MAPRLVLGSVRKGARSVTVTFTARGLSAVSWTLLHSVRSAEAILTTKAARGLRAIAFESLLVWEAGAWYAGSVSRP
jgi:hypothetical protein